jgi:hypothetical protein
LKNKNKNDLSSDVNLSLIIFQENSFIIQEFKDMSCNFNLPNYFQDLNFVDFNDQFCIISINAN